LHDARMTTLGQWWRRQIRSGFARGQERARAAANRSRSGVRQVWSIWCWGALLPVVMLLTALPTHGWSLLLLVAYPAMALRMRHRYRRLNPAFTSPGLYAASLMAGKIPEAIGLARYHLSRPGHTYPKVVS
jgi:hypothetical protein